MTLARIKNLDDLSGSQRWTLVILSSYADENGECWPSQKELAEVTGFSRNTIGTNLRILKEKGYISSQQRIDKDGDLTTNLYTINAEKVPPQQRKSNVIPIRQTTEEKLTDRFWDKEQVNFDV